jgi:hypothetical protein
MIYYGPVPGQKLSKLYDPVENYENPEEHD